jgi:hypothetical protein
MHVGCGDGRDSEVPLFRDILSLSSPLVPGAVVQLVNSERQKQGAGRKYMAPSIACRQDM